MDLTPADLLTVLGSRSGALVLTAAGLAGTAYPYPGQRVILTRGEVEPWVAAYPGKLSKAAEALGADLAWAVAA